MVEMNLCFWFFWDAFLVMIFGWWFFGDALLAILFWRYSFGDTPLMMIFWWFPFAPLAPLLTIFAMPLWNFLAHCKGGIFIVLGVVLGVLLKKSWFLLWHFLPFCRWAFPPTVQCFWIISWRFNVSFVQWRGMKSVIDFLSSRFKKEKKYDPYLFWKNRLIPYAVVPVRPSLPWDFRGSGNAHAERQRTCPDGNRRNRRNVWSP